MYLDNEIVTTHIRIRQDISCDIEVEFYLQWMAVDSVEAFDINVYEYISYR